MAQYDDFRLQINPNLGAGGGYALEILDCPLPELAGPQGAPDRAFPVQRLVELRNPDLWNGGNAGALRAIGSDALAAVTNNQVRAALTNSLAASRANGKRLRIVFTLLSGENQPAAEVPLAELPVEALYEANANYYAVNTPISRSLRPKPHLDPYALTPPLRVLVVVASPTGLPPARMQEERQAIVDALAPLTAGANRLVNLEVCEPPTRAELNRRLQSPFHVVHFIAHGAVGRTGSDPTPRAFICLEDDTRSLDPLDAETLDLALRNTEVRLVVMTACSTARLPPAPPGTAYGATAYDGMAQRLLSPLSSNLAAVVAMQFDFDADAAVVFSRALYEALLVPNMTLDEAVTRARGAIVAKFAAGHRAWVNPVLYWRCKEGRAFQVNAILPPTLDPETQKQLAVIDAQIDVFRKNLDKIAQQPENVRQAAAELVAEWTHEIEQLFVQRGILLGDSIRLWGGSAAPGTVVRCRATARLRKALAIDRLQIALSLPPELEFVAASAGQHYHQAVLAGQAAGKIIIQFQGVTGGVTWAEGEYELALVDLRVKAGTAVPSVTVPLEIQDITPPGNTPLRPIHAVVFVALPAPAQ